MGVDGGNPITEGIVGRRQLSRRRWNAHVQATYWSLAVVQLDGEVEFRCHKNAPRPLDGRLLIVLREQRQGGHAVAGIGDKEAGRLYPMPRQRSIIRSFFVR